MGRIHSCTPSPKNKRSPKNKCKILPCLVFWARSTTINPTQCDWTCTNNEVLFFYINDCIFNILWNNNLMYLRNFDYFIVIYLNTESGIWISTNFNCVRFNYVFNYIKTMYYYWWLVTPKIAINKKRRPAASPFSFEAFLYKLYSNIAKFLCKLHNFLSITRESIYIHIAMKQRLY